MAAATGVRVYMPSGEADRLSAPPDVALEGGEQLEIGPFSVQVLAVPGHSPAHIAYLIEDALLVGDVLFAGSVGRTDLEGSDPARSSAACACSSRPCPPRRGCSRVTARRRRWRASARRTRSSKTSDERGDRAPPRHPRLAAAARRAAPARDRRRDRDVRARGLPPDRHARLRGHRALRPHCRRDLGRGLQGDVLVPRPQRARADAAPRGHGAGHARLPPARALARAAAGAPLVRGADVPLRGARRPGATASTTSSGSRRSARRTRRSTPR